jgi:hypothetical protein
VLDACIAATANRFTLGEIKPEQGDVLYLALEDSKRRLQRRVTKLLPTFSGKWPESLTITTRWRRLHEGGLDTFAVGMTMPKKVASRSWRWSTFSPR